MVTQHVGDAACLPSRGRRKAILLNDIWVCRGNYDLASFCLMVLFLLVDKPCPNYYVFEKAMGMSYSSLGSPHITQDHVFYIVNTH